MIDFKSNFRCEYCLSYKLKKNIYFNYYIKFKNISNKMQMTAVNPIFYKFSKLCLESF